MSIDLTHVLFFFFQAEDGIRDADVTGVQTCALPILRARQSRGHITPSCVARGFKAWTRQIGVIDSGPPGPGGAPAPFGPSLITPYALRHSYAQRHADAGVPVDVLKELMDHVSVTTTMGYYQNPRELHQTGEFVQVAC